MTELPLVKEFDDTYSHCVTLPECERQTD